MCGRDRLCGHGVRDVSVGGLRGGGGDGIPPTLNARPGEEREHVRRDVTGA